MTKDKKTFDKSLSFYAAADMFQDSILAADNNGALLFINKSALKLFGYTLKSILNKDLSSLLPGFNSNVLRKLKKNKKLDYNGRTKNNSTLYLELSHNEFRQKGKTITLLVLRDITRLKRVTSERDKLKSKISEYSGKLENILKDTEMLLVSAGISEKKYRNLAESSPVAVTRLDALTDKYEFVNKEFIRQSGYTKDEFNFLSKREIFDMVHPDDRESLYRDFKKWAKSGYSGILNHVYRINNKNNELLWLDAYFYPEFDLQDNITCVNQIYVDITQLKKNEEELRMLGHAIESTTEMITITDLDNRFMYVNKAFEEKYGYSLKEILGKKADILGSFKNIPDIHDKILKETAKGGWEGELVNIKKDRSEFPILLSTSQIKDKNGKVIGYIGVARDITEIKNAYDRLKHSLVEKEILLKEVYHRVKNNMQVISSLLNIQSQTVADPATIELFKETQNRVRIMQLIHEKLYKSQDLSKIDFSLYIRDLVSQLRRAYPVSKNVEVKINSDGIYLGVDKAIPCGLIINELISNAYKYAFNDNLKNGEIYIELTSPEAEKYCLIVSDNGIGIPKSVDITNTESLGMILINTLTQQLDGAVEINRFKGTKFTIRF